MSSTPISPNSKFAAGRLSTKGVALIVRRPRATSSSATPIFCRSSSERAWTTSARLRSERTGALSIIRPLTPRAASSAAITRPVGPAPTTSTSVSLLEGLSMLAS